jgi:hypothetical protein
MLQLQCSESVNSNSNSNSNNNSNSIGSFHKIHIKTSMRIINRH